jgi:hypothetical protein
MSRALMTRALTHPRDDYVSFRHHTYAAPAGPKSIELKEVGQGAVFGRKARAFVNV